MKIHMVLSSHLKLPRKTLPKDIRRMFHGSLPAHWHVNEGKLVGAPYVAKGSSLFKVTVEIEDVNN